MSKRIFPQEYGERKKAKLDVTVSDHNFPLSQNVNSNKGNNQDTWGDENDDEILLLASQACEDAYNDQNISALGDYSFCMKPSSTSTQLDPIPSTSKAPFMFKKPTSSPLSTYSTKLRDKCERISSPLPGVSAKVNKEHLDISDDFIFNDKILKGQNSDQFYKQLLQLQEENAKLKSENGKLLEKCVTKEGEASILRTQLKTCQVAVDNARLDKVKAQEKAKMEWMEKIGSANNQIQDLRNQLDFKNLEIISIKEKCKMLESSKIKLTQVTVAGNDISMSHKHNSYIERDSLTQARRAIKTVTNSAQTNNQSHFLKLNVLENSDSSSLKRLLPLIMEATPTQHSVLEYNEKLRKTDAVVNKCRVYSSFHRLPSTPNVGRRRNKLTLANLYEDLTCIAAGDKNRLKILNILNTLKAALEEVYEELSSIAQRLTTAFQREMDEKYIESTATLTLFEANYLISGRTLYKEEQAILARRLAAIFSILVQSDTEFILKEGDSELNELLNLVLKICNVLDSTSLGVLYSSLLSSITLLLSTLGTKSQTNDIIKSIVLSRPMPVVAYNLVPIVPVVPMCCGMNLRTDYDQGVLLYRKDSCLLQVLLKQVEVALKCMESQRLGTRAVQVTRDLLFFYTKLQSETSSEKSRCDCQLVAMQVIVYALRVCAGFLRQTNNCEESQTNYLTLCRSGVQLLYQCVVRDVEFASQLGYNEGHLEELCEVMGEFQHEEIYNTMLSEISNTFQSSPEDVTPAFTKAAWLNSFDSFSLTD